MEWLGAAVVLAGVFFLAVGAIGFVRLPDVYCRLHMTGVVDTLGAPLVLLGIALTIGPSLAAGKLILGLVFLYVTSPLVGHLLALAAWRATHETDMTSPRNVALSMDRQGERDEFSS